MHVFISSPYSDGDKLSSEQREANVKRSIAIANELIERGHIPFVPLLSHYWNEETPHDYSTWLMWSLSWLKRCDCVLRVGGWSTGTVIEERAAREANIPVYFSVLDIPDVGNIR